MQQQGSLIGVDWSDLDIVDAPLIGCSNPEGRALNGTEMLCIRLPDLRYQGSL